MEGFVLYIQEKNLLFLILFYSHISHKHANNASSISRMHDSLLRKVLRGEKYSKLYSYRYLINGFDVLVTPQQAFKLANRREVSNVVLDFSVRTATSIHHSSYVFLSGHGLKRVDMKLLGKAL